MQDHVPNLTHSPCHTGHHTLLGALFEDVRKRRDKRSAQTGEYTHHDQQGQVTAEARGGEEDGVDNTGIDSSKLYTQPEEVAYAYELLNAISPNFTIAAAFGNVHGVYKPGNVQLTPVILKNSQDFIRNKYGIEASNPVNFVFHGGSGSTRAEIREGVEYGVIKMNIDTDTQWSFWDGVRAFELANRDYLQAQLGNPDGAEKPNKKYYDPRKWLREGEKATVNRLLEAFEDLNSLGAYDRM